MKDTVISYSGGKDSTALLIHAIEVLGRDNFRVVYQDTGYEHSTHYEYIDYIQKKLDVEIEIVRSEKYTGMFDMIEKKNALPNAMSRFCTDELKQKPFKEWLRRNKNIRSVWIGIRAEESKARKERYSDYGEDNGFPLSAYPVFGKKEFSNIMVYLPIVEWTEAKVWEYHDNYNIKPNPQYLSGAKRVGCYPCILASDRAWKLAWETKEGKDNINTLNKLEQHVQNSRGKTKNGHIITLRRNQTVKEFIRIMEVEDSQAEMFDDKEELSCSWCKG